jgi:RNA polymerase sigma factor (sigma-70 family)
MSTDRLNCVLRQLREATGESGRAGDLQLLERFVTQRDDAAFGALLARHGAMVLGVCRRALRDPAAAEDAFQATFLVLVRRAASLGSGESLANWLYGVACRTAARAKAEATRRRAREAAALRPNAPSDPLGEISARELLAVVDEELSQLSPRYRSPLVLCYFEGLTRDEAARSCGWSLATFARRLRRGRELLKARLTRRGVGLPAALLPLVFAEGSASAALPAPLVHSTTAAAAAVAAGGAVPSAGAAALAQGVLKTMSHSKLRIALVALLLGGVLGTGFLVARMQAAAPPADPSRVSAVEGVPVPAGDDGRKPAEDAKKEDAKKAKAEALTGTWALLCLEGLNMNVHQKHTFEGGRDTVMLDGKKWVHHTRGDDGKVKKVGEYDIEVDAEKDPPRLTIQQTTTPEKFKIRFIYEVKGDTLRLCHYSVAAEDGVEVVAWPDGFDLDKLERRLCPGLRVYQRVDPRGEKREPQSPKEWKSKPTPADPTGAAAGPNPDGPKEGKPGDPRPGAKGAPAPADAKAKAKAEALTGTWAYVSFEDRGPNDRYKVTLRDEEDTVTIDGKKWNSHTRKMDGGGECDMVADAGKDPPRLTVHFKTGKAHCIYEVKGDTLRVCHYAAVAGDGAEVTWPDGFDLDKLDARKRPTLRVLKRVEPKGESRP